MADLVTAPDIEDFPGAPFAPDVLTAAGETVRTEAGWHIAPSETDTVTLDSRGGCTLYLPSKMVTALVEVRDVTGTNPVVLTGVSFKANGRLYRRNGFPCGKDAVEVEFTHGYTECPKDLLPIVAALASSSGTSTTVRQKSLGSASVTISDTSAAYDPSSPIYRYALWEL